MTEGQDHEWHIELDDIRARVHWALNNLDDISKRNDVKGKIETVIWRLNDMCEQTQGESK